MKLMLGKGHVVTSLVSSCGADSWPQTLAFASMDRGGFPDPY
jgi:hypothetical protein